MQVQPPTLYGPEDWVPVSKGDRIVLEVNDLHVRSTVSLPSRHGSLQESSTFGDAIHVENVRLPWITRLTCRVEVSRALARREYKPDIGPRAEDFGTLVSITSSDAANLVETGDGRAPRRIKQELIVAPSLVLKVYISSLIRAEGWL